MNRLAVSERLNVVPKLPIDRNHYKVHYCPQNHFQGMIDLIVSPFINQAESELKESIDYPQWIF